MAKNDLKKKIGEQIRAIRKDRHLNQREFVVLFNTRPPANLTMTVQDLSKYENAINNISAEKYVKVLTLSVKSIGQADILK